MRQRVAALMAAAMLLGGCQGAAPPGQGPPGAAGGVAAADPHWVRGEASLSGSHVTLRICDSGDTTSIVDPSASLANRVREVAGDAGTAYAEIAGVDGAIPDPRQRGSRRPALLLTTINRVTPVGEGGGCNRAPGAWLLRAGGNEPFWSIEVYPDSLVFMQPEEPTRRAFPAADHTDDGTTRRWEVATGTRPEHVMMLEVTRAPCHDSMSGAFMSSAAHVTFYGRELTGCAFDGVIASTPPREPGARGSVP